MLYIKRDPKELWDDEKNEFVETAGISLVLEHSLISISKWEAKWHKPFLSDKAKTDEEMLDYIRCMTMTQNVKPEVFKNLPPDVIEEVNQYIGDPMSATTFQDNRPPEQRGGMKKKEEIITSELIYYWMIAYQIPFDCQKWHLTRLMNLIKICGIKAEEQDPKAKNRMSRKEILSRNAQLNAARRKQLHTSG